MLTDATPPAPAEGASPPLALGASPAAKRLRSSTNTNTSSAAGGAEAAGSSCALPFPSAAAAFSTTSSAVAAFGTWGSPAAAAAASAFAVPAASEQQQQQQQGGGGGAGGAGGAVSAGRWAARERHAHSEQVVDDQWLVPRHGQSGRLDGAMAGHHQLVMLHPKAWGRPPRQTRRLSSLHMTDGHTGPSPSLTVV